jgi:hypothetical protein
MDAQRATLEPVRMARENDPSSAEIVKKSRAKLREFKTLSRMASRSYEQRQIRISRETLAEG